MNRLSRPQVLVLVTSTAQLVSALVGLPVLGEAHRVLLMFTGLLGLACAWRRHHARLYGAGLVLGYGAIAYAGIGEEALVLHLRAVLAGLVIVVVPARRDRAAVGGSLEGEAK